MNTVDFIIQDDSEDKKRLGVIHTRPNVSRETLAVMVAQADKDVSYYIVRGAYNGTKD